MQPFGLQEWIHKIEEGEGTRYVRLVFAALALLGLTALWHLREAKNFVAIEAMDAAQIGRNIAEGRGYSTRLVRPLSIALIEGNRGGGVKAELLTKPHPDLANAPVYPVILAGLFKIMPMNWTIVTAGFWRYQPEWLVGGLNQLLFFGALVLLYRVSARLFDKAVGALAAVLMALTEMYWEFTTSGLSTMLLIVFFLWLVNVLITFEEGAREGRTKGWMLGMAAYAGAVVGLMALTRYSMGWLIVPVAVFLAMNGGASRGQVAATSVALLALLLGPWMARNYQVSGTLFGTAGFALHEGTGKFSGHVLERSMPKNVRGELNNIELQQYPRKLFVNGRDILTDELPRTAGNWIGAFFLGAMLIPFRNPALAKLKYFAGGTVLLLVVVQALGRTALSAEAPLINSENLLVVVAPLFFLFGCGLFYILLDQIELPAPWLRSVIIVGFVALLSLPMIFRLLPPRGVPVMYPPYWPPLVQEVSSWLEPEEMMMSDMPWAVAWYGNRQCVWTTMDAGQGLRDDFYSINDERKAIKGLYLTPITTNAKFLTDMRQGPEGVWGRFYLDVVVMKNLPKGFPLKQGHPGVLPDYLFLSDRIRWPQ
jgi:hypothetical protein